MIKLRNFLFLVWLVPILTVVLAHFLTINSTPVIRMLAIVGLLFVGMKFVVFFFTPKQTRPSGKNLLWFLCWPGMRPSLFSKGPDAESLPADLLLKEGSVRLFSGALLLLVAQLEFPLFLKMVFVMVGWSLLLHFGLFTLITAFYRYKGWKVRQPFFEPWNATGVGDFWSRRWNRIFSEMLSQSISRPMIKKAGRTTAVMAVFGVSGLLHEAAITLPLGKGYGGPLCYFLLQGFMVLAEGRLKDFRGFPRVLVFAIILLPLPLLFPVSFVRDVMMRMAGVFL